MTLDPSETWPPKGTRVRVHRASARNRDQRAREGQDGIVDIVSAPGVRVSFDTPGPTAFFTWHDVARGGLLPATKRVL